jgi:hypothetical protein
MYKKIIVSAILLFFVIGCGSDNNKTTNGKSATETPTPTHPHSSLLPNRLSTTPILLA